MRYMPVRQRYLYLLFLSPACTSPITKPHIDFIIIMVSTIHCEWMRTERTCLRQMAANLSTSLKMNPHLNWIRFCRTWDIVSVITLWEWKHFRNWEFYSKIIHWEIWCGFCLLCRFSHRALPDSCSWAPLNTDTLSIIFCKVIRGFIAIMLSHPIHGNRLAISW